MTVHAVEDCRMVVRYRVNVCLCWCFLLRPQCMVPAASNNPLAGTSGLHTSSDALLHVVERLAAHQINIQLFKAARAQMHMSVVEAGHHKVTTKIDNLGFWALEFLNFLVSAGSNDVAARNSERLCSSICRELWTVLGFTCTNP